MSASIIKLIELNFDTATERILAHILQTIPRYGLVPRHELFESIQRMLTDLLGYLRQGDHRQIADEMVQLFRKRHGQRYSISEFHQALMSVFPVIRELIRETSDPQEILCSRDYDDFELRTHAIVSLAADVQISEFSCALQAKDEENKKLWRQLSAQPSPPVEQSALAQALTTGAEFNKRVIESLTGGLLVIDSQTLALRFFSQRLAEIIGIPPEQALGRDVRQVLSQIGGLEVDALIHTVRSQGRLPLTKLRLSLPGGRQVAVVIQGQRMLDPQGNPEGTVVVIDDVTEREILLESFSRYVSRDLVARVLARDKALELSAERRVCTVMFADIRGFTSLAEEMEPAELHLLLNEYFQELIGCISLHAGFIDKFIGDNVMALFGTASAPATGALMAVKAAAAIIKGIRQLDARREAAGKRGITVGIGINTGELLLGNIGSRERMDFTAIGDAVNVASRLQSLAPPWAVYLGEQTAQLVTGQVAFSDKGKQTVKGRRQPVAVYVLDETIAPVGDLD